MIYFSLCFFSWHTIFSTSNCRNYPSFSATLYFFFYFLYAVFLQRRFLFSFVFFVCFLIVFICDYYFYYSSFSFPAFFPLMNSQSSFYVDAVSVLVHSSLPLCVCQFALLFYSFYFNFNSQYCYNLFPATVFRWFPILWLQSLTFLPRFILVFYYVGLRLFVTFFVM